MCVWWGRRRKRWGDLLSCGEGGRWRYSLVCRYLMGRRRRRGGMVWFVDVYILYNNPCYVICTSYYYIVIYHYFIS